MTTIREALRGRTLLVTGFTGFLAKVLVAMLLDRTGARLVLLARGRRGKSAAERVQRIFERSPCFRELRRRHGDGLGAFLEERVEIVCGDAREPMLGVSERALAQISRRIDCVVHVAGLTDFEVDPKDGVAVNVRGTLHAADLAARTRGKRLVHVSTAYVAGQGSREVPETLEMRRSPNGTRFDPFGELLAIESVCEAIDARHEGDHAAASRARVEAGTRRALALGWANLYTYTKGLAEHLLAERDDVAISLVRPSIVECAREFPFPGWNEGINTSGPLVWLTGTLHRRMPFRAKNRFDVVPVDAVARGICVVTSEALEAGSEAGIRSIRHLASSDHNPLTLGRALDLTSLAHRRNYAASEDPFERLVLAHFDSVLHERPAATDPWLPAARKATRALRDALVAFDPDVHLPRTLRDRFGDSLAKRAQKTAKAVGTASRTIGQIEEMLRVYQPFVFDEDLVFRTDEIRRATAMLDDEERALFGFDADRIEWRGYWLDVQMPGLAKWSLPLLRGERAPEDPEVPLDRPLRALEGGDRPRRPVHAPEPRPEAAEEAE
jgi:long-chain acyl-CoA synthetase